MYAILGLGNPGEPYRRTRHNLGFTVVEHLAAQLEAEWQEADLYLFAPARIDEVPVVLVKPMTFINRSGLAATSLKQQLAISTEELLVILDDVNLPLGKTRLRLRGSDGGHKGLASLIWSLCSQQFPRLRLGTGPCPEGKDLVEFVLGEFKEEELPVVQNMILRTIQGVKLFVCSGAQQAANFLNQS
ncbi:MAG: aminoacyl-tRNA hydrolase [Candidatus Latescibacteria bacterium 4484_181]|nr:MAG: aminoacyl-tRNA hydrolase [Candidatus Latescibacteria bacterium 4484_181]RKY69614.1 MAG: aminoacyl-tRNA hydrolase [Candidatus Latescibacterota bacterium]RKY73916.1 MAG: aminoacyl-tRNA hydrolase [Candidatus Latescibacterota bacterium]